MKIVFIINSISAQRCIKRIEEFIAHGYEVEAYGFSRKMVMWGLPKHFSIEVVGEFDNLLPYTERLKVLNTGIRKVLRKVSSKENVVFYLFQLDVAMVFRLLAPNRKYVFEESDLMHTYVRNPLIQGFLELTDKWVIRHSLLSIFTSEGFLRYHYGKNWPKNTCVVTNRLNVDIESLSKEEKKEREPGRLSIGFVGNPRFKTISQFIAIYCANFPDYEFHIYGTPTGVDKADFNALHTFENCFFHGAFVNPDDLPMIYANLDFVLYTSDTSQKNPRFADPNKFYESIYFETPIIVSKGSFLADRVHDLGIGYSVDVFDKDSIIRFVKGLTRESIEEKRQACKAIDKRCCLNVNDDFFEKLSIILGHAYQ